MLMREPKTKVKKFSGLEEYFQCGLRRVTAAHPPWEGLKARAAASCLRKQLPDQRTLDIRQPEITALEAVGQLGVVETQQVQDCRLDVVHVNPLGRGVAKIVRSTHR